MTKIKDDQLAASINNMARKARMSKEGGAISEKLFSEAAAALAATTPGIGKSTITELMNHALQSDATPPSSAEQLSDTKQLISDVVKDAIEQTAVNAALKQVKEMRSDTAGALDDNAENKDNSEKKDPLLGNSNPFANTIKQLSGHSSKMPYTGQDFRGIVYSKNLLDKINANILNDFGSTDAYMAAKNAEARAQYYPHVVNRKDPATVANRLVFDSVVYANVINSVFYHSTEPSRPAYNELTIMPSVINKIRQYERVYGTSEVLSPSARQALIMSCLLSEMNGTGLSYIGELANPNSYPSEMGISETEATHILALISTLNYHRTLGKVIRKIKDSDETVDKLYKETMATTVIHLGSDYYSLTNAMRKVHVLKRMASSMVPEGVMQDLIVKRKNTNNYAAKVDASARLRRAAISFIEGNSFADLLVAIGSFSIETTKEYQEAINDVDYFFSYLSNNGIKFTDVYDDTVNLRDMKFSKLGRYYNYGDDYSDEQPF